MTNIWGKDELGVAGAGAGNMSGKTLWKQILTEKVEILEKNLLYFLLPNLYTVFKYYYLALCECFSSVPRDNFCCDLALCK